MTPHGLPVINPQVVHKSYPDLWKTHVDNLVGKQGKTRGHRVDNRGKPGRHTQDTPGVHTARTVPVHKKEL